MTSDEIKQKLHQQIDQLPADLLVMVADFLEFVQFKRDKGYPSVAQAAETQAGSSPQTSPQQPRRSIKGLCADLNLHVSEEDIAGARKEMWANFPREDTA